MKILIIGGYGVFGGRLAQLLSDEPRLTLFIAGRTLHKAEQFCAGIEGAATMVPVALDRSNPSEQLASLAPEMVVDATGPFQDYGDDRYALVEAAIAHKIHYLDFADGADFVFGVSRFDAAAKAAGVFVFSGVSSFPVLTAAVLREFAKTMTIESVTGGIAPSPYAGIGLNVMRAVVGYAGSPVKLQRGGKPSSGVGLAESMRYVIAAPGKVPLNSIHFSLVDVPDLQVLPPEHPSITDLWIGAGPVPEILYRILNLLAKLRHRLKLPSMLPLSSLFYWVLNKMKFGEHRGGMFVAAMGQNGGKPASQSWHLLAEGDDGPFIPSMAIEGIVRKALAGDMPAAGARAATHALELNDYDKLFDGRTIHTGIRDDLAQAPLYQHVLGTAYDKLPPRVQELHGSSDKRSWSGMAKVARGKGPFAAIAARMFRFPKSADAVAVQVDFTPTAKGELWERRFGDHCFNSLQYAGTSKNEHLIIEQFGPVKIALALRAEEDRLYLVPRRWTMLGVPLPKFLLPQGNTFETERDGKFVFDVELALPIFGLIVSYKGSLLPD
ncbi:MAG: DUF4166 domain-containing protein [Marinomonas sp.]